MRRRTNLIAVTMLVLCTWMPLLKAGSDSSEATEKTTQAVQTENIDSYIHQQMQARNIPGLALGILEHGRLVVNKAYGIANLETDTPVKTSSIFELASVTKPFTAAAVMLLVQDGKVGLDEPIRTYILDTPEAWKAITVRHLLTHTGGITMGGLVWLDNEGKLSTNGGTALMNISTSTTARVLLPYFSRRVAAARRVVVCDG